ncbi:terpene synthase family protein [Streptomyces netropsis]|uniref:terpene synthase family protein n=1 Tax=Streptomyces netropsis TaxID=55404 RepID=UPI00379718A4
MASAADDAHVDRVERDSGRFGLAITRILDVLDHDRPQDADAEDAWERAFIDICERLREVLPHHVFRRFADGMRLYLMSAAWMILRHSCSETLRIREYKAIRRYIDACAPCVALLSLEIDEADYTDPRLYRMYQHAANVVDWSNDVLSLFVEARQPGHDEHPPQPGDGTVRAGK